MEEEEQIRHRSTHTENEHARVSNLGYEQRGNNRTTCTAQERARINRLVGENHTTFNEANARNQHNYWHNQGANNADEYFKQYFSPFDKYENLPLEDHPYSVVEKNRFYDSLY